jgi:ABC-2 type transport system permease protein
MPLNPTTAAPAVAAVRPRPWLAAVTLGRREIVRFFRQRNRVVGAVGQPILLWLLFGIGMNRSFAVAGQNFSEYYIPGTLVLILLFTAIFATISIIEDRREGFLQSVLVAPIPRWSMVLGKVWGGALIAVLQSLLFLALALTIGIRFGPLTFAAVVVWLTVQAIALTSLGFVIAWQMESTQGFHAIMSLVLMPMWLLSGAFFPVPALTASSTWAEIVLHWITRLNPVTYGVAGVRRQLQAEVMPASMGGAVGREEFWMPNLAVSWSVTIAFALTMFVLACRVAGRRTTGDYQ